MLTISRHTYYKTYDQIPTQKYVFYVLKPLKKIYAAMHHTENHRLDIHQYEMQDISEIISLTLQYKYDNVETILRRHIPI